MTEKLNTRHKIFIFLSFCPYLVYAVYGNIFGTDAPVMMNYYGITSGQQGFILTMQSVGTIAAAIFIALRGERYNKIHTIAMGLLLFGAASASIIFAPSYGLLIIIVMAAGVGGAFVDIMTNSVISDVYPARKNTLLPIAHAFYGVGAMIAPLFVTLTVNFDTPQSFVTPFLIIGIATVAVAACYMVSGRRIMAGTPYTDREAVKKRVSENPAEVFKTKKAWALLAAGVLYFTFQQGIAAWLPTYAMRTAGADFNTAGLLLTAFFAGALVMRFLSPLFLKLLAPKTVFSMFGLVAAAFMLIAVLVPGAMMPFTALSGFMQGASVATFVLVCCNEFPHRTASASSICTLAGGAATLTAPLWMGEMAERLGFKVPIIIICGCLFAASFLILFLERKKRSVGGEQ